MGFSAAMHAPRPLPVEVPARGYERRRLRLADGAQTTLHLAWFHRAAVRLRVTQTSFPGTLLAWCRANGAPDALVGGFFVRPGRAPLGELRIDGERRESVPFDYPWGLLRSSVHVSEGDVRIARRPEIALEPDGDLVQAGPLLVEGQRSLILDGGDPEGFSAGAHQFDSDITRGRYPRAALAIAGPHLIAAVCDGRSGVDAGMTLQELAAALVELGARTAINLDGGGSASLVYGSRLRNRPREEHGIEILGGRPISTALIFDALQPISAPRLPRGPGGATPRRAR